ncbi:pre-mRNA branch site protein p14 [Monocercomonoides exilis]|uniref:pre-mRNA branch site protein p14 n=1 Tax=Monocercomonoides exilis TaxID=2049356 RepID=UPI003559CF4B|nr:pre-mRNA branch site protein p14 [Monocercomonoides exilis]|eukprot:MONOS_7119.1-p1 / transcript=MONOS_7119.1 / gene=MONOS_7119 / organism=Monocercomonoides_exilis_PA203 / gene_product=pre-mRNA branch site protein p14 / transcript_product=pre-mRNA branch site protein p14 / location=Mono_scaffold00236:77289-77912(+) / protein_length=125 / sequence_SO=supercontig / SO=protein_coding / is_pseudo=false
MSVRAKAQERLAPEVNRILFVRNLPFKFTSEEMYKLFGQYGAIRQIRVGSSPDTKGTAFVIYEDIYDAKNACEHLSGFNVSNRYLVVLYYSQAKMTKKLDQKKQQAELERIRATYQKKPEASSS